MSIRNSIDFNAVQTTAVTKNLSARAQRAAIIAAANLRAVRVLHNDVSPILESSHSDARFKQNGSGELSVNLYGREFSTVITATTEPQIVGGAKVNLTTLAVITMVREGLGFNLVAAGVVTVYTDCAGKVYENLLTLHSIAVESVGDAAADSDDSIADFSAIFSRGLAKYAPAADGATRGARPKNLSGGTMQPNQQPLEVPADDDEVPMR
jgi:hypothetical protein